MIWIRVGKGYNGIGLHGRRLAWDGQQTGLAGRLR